MKKLVMPCVAIGILLLASCASKPGEPGPNADGPTSGQGVYNAGGQVFAQSRGLEVVAPNGQRVASFQGSYALVIGESNYTAGSGWARLDGVREDTAAVRTLFEQQGFSVRVMENMNSKALKDGIESFFHDYGYEENNRLIVYYAGHGHTLSLGQNRDMGYIVPVDAPNPATERVKFMQLAVPMSWFDTWAKQLVSRHALFMFDSCFAGSVFATTRASPGIIDYKIANPVRQFITSGGANETVSDQSIFRRQLERGLREGAADLNHDGYVSGSELGDFLQSTVVNYSYNAQHPQYGKVRDPALDQGDFVFAVRLASTPTPSPSPSPSPAVSTGSVQVTSAVAGSIVIDGTDTGVRIKADGTATVSGVSTGQTEVGVKSSDGRITKAAQTVLVRAGQTVGAVIAMPAPVLTAPRNVRAGTPGTDSVSLTWDSAGSGVSYKVYYGTQNDASRAS
ncbi:caspase family protein, partial [Breznakiellaceae bacterium SP9]